MPRKQDVINLNFDVPVVEKWFSRYPKFRMFIAMGTISLKQAREMLNIDRYEMNDIYYELVEAGAVYGSGSNCFRASPKLKEYLANKIAEEAMHDGP